MLAARGPRTRRTDSRSGALALDVDAATDHRARRLRLGFVVGRFLGHKSVSHNGAVYGHSASLVLLPEAAAWAVVLGNEDLVNGTALGGGEPGPLPYADEWARRGTAAGAASAQAVPWRPRCILRGLRIPKLLGGTRIEDGRLAANISGQPTRLTPLRQSRFLAENRLIDAVPGGL